LSWQEVQTACDGFVFQLFLRTVMALPRLPRRRRFLLDMAYNAGVRALDIRNPYQPREFAYYVPASGGRTVTTNNVEVDDRGYIYIVDRHGLGMHILQLTGAARQVAKLR
jgi:hypothetical protein